MADSAPTINIFFGKGGTSDVYTETGSLWEYRYGGVSHLNNGLSPYSGWTDPIFGPGCTIQAKDNYLCYAAPTGHAGPEGSRKYDYVTLKRGQDTYVYLDVGFWGGADKRCFGLVCGPHVWLCDYAQQGSAPEPTDLFANELYHFHKAMGGFKVTTHATVPLDKSDSSDGSAKIHLILPDMHMWPEPEVLRYRRKEFFDPEELKALDGGLKDGTLLRKTDGSVDIPIEKGDSYEEHSLKMITTPQGRAAMKENAFTDIKKMREEEEQHAFGSTAGADLVKLLNALDQARKNADNPFDVNLLHVGDLLEMWAPYHTWAGSKPFIYETAGLKLSATANERVPKWINMVYGYGHNQAALQALQNAGCRQIYGNHDVYLAFDEWKFTKVGAMDRLRNSRGFFSDNLLWVEHGHRFDPSNRDGYWMWIDLDHPPGALVNTGVNYHPFLRLLGDKYDNSEANLYKKNLPYATIWYLLANYARADSGVGFRPPPKFRIFCQGHTHCPVLLKVNVYWSRLDGKYPGTPIEEDVMKEEQRREQGARDGSYNPATTEELLIYLERRREKNVRYERNLAPNKTCSANGDNDD